MDTDYCSQFGPMQNFHFAVELCLEPKLLRIVVVVVVVVVLVVVVVAAHADEQ